jgi:hypothetical protein
MRPGITLLCVLALTLPGQAADEHKVPAALTPKEVEEGWILLFDGETTFGWHSPDGSEWTTAQGTLAPQAGKTGLLVTTAAFRDCELRFEYRADDDSQAQIRVGNDADVRPKFPAAPVGTVRPLKATAAGWYHVAMTVERGVITSSSIKGAGVGSTSQASTTNPPNRAVRIALAGKGVAFRSIKLKPLGMRPIFNGKDLTGWKEFPGRKSKFTVTPEGWLNIKNGPGDLQTKGEWADFVLQLDCISNGRHLNSGVFFRCQPDKYQQGYEAQVQNDFSLDPPKEYTVEEYDPQTHKPVGKKKVKSAAKDFGTGAIYRRVPARWQVVKDHEWFTMTVVANGRHLATWVNGVQQTDWTDNRPLSDNARNGCRLEKGPISLQGHDPTTDLSFRNIRIEDLSPGKAGEK